MGLIDERTKEHLKKDFEEKLQDDVIITMFLGEPCQYCKEIKEIITTVAELSNGKIKVEEYDFNKDKDKVEKYKIDKYPAIIIDNASNPTRNVRYYGIPSGYEFVSVVEDIFMRSLKRTNLTPVTKEEIKKVNKPVHIQVFVTPTCPHCPRAVLVAHQFAIENPNITADMIEAIEFEELSNKYQVMAVPKIVINDKVTFEGAYPENMFLDKVKEALRD